MSTPLAVTRIAHACQLIEFGDLRVLTDPWFTETATYHQGERLARSESGTPRVDSEDDQVRTRPDLVNRHRAGAGQSGEHLEVLRAAGVRDVELRGSKRTGNGTCGNCWTRPCRRSQLLTEVTPAVADPY